MVVVVTVVMVVVVRIEPVPCAWEAGALPLNCVSPV